MKWGAPEWLPYLWLIVPIAWAVFYGVRRRKRRMRKLAAAEILHVLSPYHRPDRLRTRSILWLLAILLCGVALARPQWGVHWEEVQRRGLDIMVVLDTSNSMLAEDIKPNRLQQAKWGIRDLVHKLKGDRIGLVAFAGGAFLQCPLTIDYAAFLMTLDDVYAGIIPRGGSDIARAVRRAVNSFEEKTQADRVIVLITDGEAHEGNALDMVDDLKKLGIRIYAIGIGTLDGDLIPMVQEQGPPQFLKDRQGNTVKTALQEHVLEQLALATGGSYVRAAGGDFGLDRIYDQGIAGLQRDEQESRVVQTHEDRFAWFLGAALTLLLVEALLSERRKAPLPLISQEHA